jgi:hypothetical protein
MIVNVTVACLTVAVQIRTTAVPVTHTIGPKVQGMVKQVTELNEAEIEEYLAGYDYNEQYGDKKSWD